MGYPSSWVTPASTAVKQHTLLPEELDTLRFIEVRPEPAPAAGQACSASGLSGARSEYDPINQLALMNQGPTIVSRVWGLHL